MASTINLRGILSGWKISGRVDERGDDKVHRVVLRRQDLGNMRFLLQGSRCESSIHLVSRISRCIGVARDRVRNRNLDIAGRFGEAAAHTSKRRWSAATAGEPVLYHINKRYICVFRLNRYEVHNLRKTLVIMSAVHMPSIYERDTRRTTLRLASGHRRQLATGALASWHLDGEEEKGNREPVPLARILYMSGFLFSL